MSISNGKSYKLQKIEMKVYQMAELIDRTNHRRQSGDGPY